MIQEDFLEFDRRLQNLYRNVMDILGEPSLLTDLSRQRYRGYSFADFLSFEGQLFTVELVCSDPENIFLTDGASKGVAQVLNALIRDEKDGVSFLHVVPFKYLTLWVKTICCQIVTS